MRLYYHRTSGGAEYLCSECIKGTEEGSFNSKYIVRIDGNIKKDAELNVKRQLEFYDNHGKTFDRYTVIINGHIYTMSNNPNMPNEACIYHGTQIDMKYLKENNVKIDWKELPEAVQKKIKELQLET